MAGGGNISIGRDGVGNVIASGDHSMVEAYVTAAKHEMSSVDPTAVDIAAELEEIRTILSGLASDDARKMGRALDDVSDEIGRKTGVNKDELGNALQRALGYAKSASTFATVATKLAPHLRNTVLWLGDKWTSLLTYLV